MKHRLVFATVILSLLICAGLSFGGTPYDIGIPTITEIYVDPVHGDDGNSGTRPDQALRTITSAWNSIPGAMSATGYRINMLPGTYPCEPGPESTNCINYFSDKVGTYQYPVIMRATEGPDTVTVRGGFNFKNVHYLYLIDLNLVGGGSLPTNSSGNNLLHLEEGNHVLLRRLSVVGPNTVDGRYNNLQEALKVNQSQYLFVEDSTIGGAWHTSADYMVVQYGHFLNNHFHTAGQWCLYVKGGASYLRIEGNEFGDVAPRQCLLGFEAGEAANFAMTVMPWIHYDVYDIKFVNNVLHDIPGSAMVVAGGYNVLFAYNTLYRVGTDTSTGYSLLDGLQGDRNCTPTSEFPNAAERCRERIDLGGWGPDFVTETESVTIVPNRNVYFFNNLFYNPPTTQTLYSHLGIRGPITPIPAGWHNITDPSRADDNLSIRGNMIWNGPTGLPLGIEEPGQGCQPSNPTCNATQLVADNTINVTHPELVAPAGGDFRPTLGGSVFGAATYSIPDFMWADAPTSPVIPPGTLSNAVLMDRDGYARTVTGPPGAYSRSSACTYTLAPGEGTIGLSGGTGTITVTAASPDCTWSAATDDLWVRISSGGSGTGSGTVAYTVDPLTIPFQRTGRIRVGSSVFVITQSTPVQKHTLSLSRNGNGRVVSSPSGLDCGDTCSHEFAQGTTVTLTATADPGWVFTGWNGPCTGKGTCSVVMSGNVSLTATFSSCTYVPNPTGKILNSYRAATFSIGITAIPKGCPAPTVAVAEGNTWICPSTPQFTLKTGKGSVKVRAEANPLSSARPGALRIGQTPFSVQQAGKSCTVTLNPAISPLLPKGGGGPFSFKVNASPSDCTWNADSASSWVHVVSASSGVGPGIVSYHVDPKPGTSKATRNGKVNVTYKGGKVPKVYTVKQGIK